MFPRHYIDVIKASGYTYASVCRELRWSEGRFQTLRTECKEGMDAKEYKQMSEWIEKHTVMEDIL
jgi:hypothetical protein